MNKLTKLFVSALLLIGFSSYSSYAALTYTPGVSVKEKNIKKNTEAIEVNLKIPVISGVKNKSIENKINNKFYNDAINFEKPLERDAKKYLADTKKDPNLHFNKYSAFTTYKTGYNKNDILSIPLRYYQYTGGANGLEIQQGYTYNLKNGKLLSLSSLFEKGFNYKKVISDEVLKQIKAHSENYFPDTIEKFKGINPEQPYYLIDGNLVVFYGPYEIAPHSSGIPEFKIPFSSLKFNKTLNIR